MEEEATRLPWIAFRLRPSSRQLQSLARRVRRSNASGVTTATAPMSVKRSSEARARSKATHAWQHLGLRLGTVARPTRAFTLQVLELYPHADCTQRAWAPHPLITFRTRRYDGRRCASPAISLVCGDRRARSPNVYFRSANTNDIFFRKFLPGVRGQHGNAQINQKGTRRHPASKAGATTK